MGVALDGSRNCDPLHVVTLPEMCPVCRSARRATNDCAICKGTGRPLATIRGIWSGTSGFLVCGGSSLREIPIERLRDRGIVSLGVNNVAGYAPVTAMTFGDGNRKFPPWILADPKMMVFCPIGKLGKRMRTKLPDGTFRGVNVRIGHCPNVYGVARSGRRFEPDMFFKTEFAQWGKSKHPKYVLATMLVGIRILRYLGVNRIYMLGVDLDRESKEDGYAFAENGSGSMRKYVKCNAMLHELKPAMQEAGVEIYNCNPTSRCDAFEYRPFSEAYQDCRGLVSNEPFDLDEWYSSSVAENMAKMFPESLNEEQARSLAAAGGMPNGDRASEAMAVLRKYLSAVGRCPSCGGSQTAHVAGCLVGKLTEILSRR